MKGLDLLLDAYRRHPEGLLPLVIAGSGAKQQEQSLVRLIEDSKAPVRWIGKVDEQGRGRLLDQAAFMVVPSREESFSLAALEALSYGRPVIHFDLPQLAWMRPAATPASLVSTSPRWPARSPTTHRTRCAVPRRAVAGSTSPRGSIGQTAPLISPWCGNDCPEP